MITSGFKNAVSQMLSNGGTAKGLLPIKDVSGTTVYLADYDDFPYDVETGFTLTASAAGISVGSGNTAVTENDYQLATPITSGLTGVVTVDKGVESGSAYITLSIALTNTSGSSITVSEICYKQEFKVASTQGGTTTSTAVCMVDRCVLDTALTIPASGQAALTYKLKATLTSGGGSTLVTKSISTNGTYDPQDDNADGYSLVTVSVQPNVGTKNIGANGTYNASSDSLDGYSTVNVSVSPNVGTKNITQNGTYNASSDSLDGYSQVTVNVSGGGGGSSVTKIYEGVGDTQNLNVNQTYTFQSNGVLIAGGLGYIDGGTIAVDNGTNMLEHQSGYYYFARTMQAVTAGQELSIVMSGRGSCSDDITIFFVDGGVIPTP